MPTKNSEAATPAEAEPEFLKLKEAAKLLRHSVKTLRRRIQKGAIRATREGGRNLIAVGDYHAYVESLRRRKRP